MPSPIPSDAPPRPIAALLAPLASSKSLLVALTLVGAVAGLLVGTFAPPSHTARVTIRKIRPEDDPFEVLRTTSQFERIVRSADVAAAAVAAAGAGAGGADPVRVAALARVHASTIAYCMELTLALPDPAAATAIASALAAEGVSRVHALRAAAIDDAARALDDLAAAARRDLDAADARALEWRRASGHALLAAGLDRLLDTRADRDARLADARRAMTEEAAVTEKLSELLRAESPFVALDGGKSGRGDIIVPSDGETGTSGAPRRVDRVPNPAHTHLVNEIGDALVRARALSKRISLLEDELAAADAAIRDATGKIAPLEIERERIELDRSLAQEAYAAAARERAAGAAFREAGSREIEVIDVSPPFRAEAPAPGAATSAVAGALVGFAIAAFAAVLRSYSATPAPRTATAAP